jgi:hypothetical protein
MTDNVGQRLAIGDMAWIATFDAANNFISCPDCGGTGRLRVILHDETQVSIGCANCAAGYDPPTGRIRVYDRRPRAEQVRINGCEIDSKEIRWRLGESTTCYRVADDADVFETEEAALERAKIIAVEADEAERNKIFRKEKDTRTWAWNASYHRNCIKRAQKDIEYHTAKLNVAKIKAKEPELA